MNRISPPLAVGMPVFNGEKYIDQAIESVLAQTYGDFEFFISDNCSTDATEDICRSYASSDKRVVYSRLDKNVGAAANFNRAFALGRSPYFKFVAHDDLCQPQFVEVCMSAFADASPAVVLCFPSAVRIDSTGAQQGVLEDRLDLRQPAPHHRFSSFLSRYNLSNPFYGVVRASVYSSTRMHQSFIAADMVLLGELALRGQFWQLPEPLFLRRFHDEMSGEAAATLGDLAVHYDTSHSGTTVLYKSRLFWEFLRSVSLAPLSTYQRLRCRQALLTAWLPRRSLAITGELTRHAITSATRRVRS